MLNKWALLYACLTLRLSIMGTDNHISPTPVHYYDMSTTNISQSARLIGRDAQKWASTCFSAFTAQHGSHESMLCRSNTTLQDLPLSHAAWLSMIHCCLTCRARALGSWSISQADTPRQCATTPPEWSPSTLTSRQTTPYLSPHEGAAGSPLKCSR